MVNAFRAGTIVAVLSALVGWFMVLRRQSFAGHTLAVVGFPGAAGAVLLGVSATYGYFVFGVVAALVIGLGDAYVRPGLQRGVGGDRHRAGARSRLRVPVRQPVRRLPRWGQRLALRQLPRDHPEPGARPPGRRGRWRSPCSPSSRRPLLFASLDPAVAAARGVPTRLLSIGFLVLLAVAAGEAAQITGALLVFALLVVPPAVAQTLTPHPGRSIAMAVRGRAARRLGVALRRVLLARTRSGSS